MVKSYRGVIINQPRGNMTKIINGLLSQARKVMKGFTDNRKENNAKKYKVEDAGMGALSIFVMQDPSFLSHQERLSRVGGMDNFKSLFGCETTPSANQIRNILDGVD